MVRAAGLVLCFEDSDLGFEFGLCDWQPMQFVTT